MTKWIPMENLDWVWQMMQQRKEKAGKGDLKARNDLDLIDNWMGKISKTAGLPEKPGNDPLGLRKGLTYNSRSGELIQMK